MLKDNGEFYTVVCHIYFEIYHQFASDVCGNFNISKNNNTNKFQVFHTVVKVRWNFHILRSINLTGFTFIINHATTIARQ